jgi:hypothetical protein
MLISLQSAPGSHAAAKNVGCPKLTIHLFVVSSAEQNRYNCRHFVHLPNPEMHIETKWIGTIRLAGMRVIIRKTTASLGYESKTTSGPTYRAASHSMVRDHTDS